MTAEKITALYECLSRNDLTAGESVSIENQKNFLEKYATERNFINIKHFSGVGVSGTLFSRLALDALIEEVKAGNVATVIFKDQSRIGRDVLEVGLLKRTFEQHNVRYIAANDGLDSAKGFDIMSIFRDVINEFYVSDCSAKIRAVKRSNAVAGKCANRPPYGFKGVNGNNQIWEIDEEVAPIVREVFQKFIAGTGIHLIAKELDSRGIPSPMVYYRQRTGLPQKNTDTTWFNYIVKFNGSFQILQKRKLTFPKIITPSLFLHRRSLVYV
jgi:DNA invertase Pin-like site-specific DNA recombinase